MMLLRRVLVAWSLAFAACGASAAEVKSAREARYEGDRSVMFKSLVDVVGSKYAIAEAHENGFTVVTKPRWYEADGTSEDRVHGADAVTARKGSVELAYRVVLSGESPPYTVEVEPRIRRDDGMLVTEPGAAEVPGWVQGRTETLILAIHDRLGPYQVKAAP